IKEPYPEIKGATNDSQTVMYLQNIYSSSHSESTAILTYVYQHLITSKFNEQLSNVFIEIGKVEMRHLELIGEAIIDFGGNPIFADSQGSFLSGKWVDYSTNIVQMLENDIKGEVEAAATYLKTADAVKNESLSKLLRRIAKDEELHAEILTSLLKQVRFWIG
ncbi:MAG: ferritin family protein, partial [Clostridia bacterium]